MCRARRRSTEEQERHGYDTPASDQGKPYTESVPPVLVLDPALGTGTDEAAYVKNELPIMVVLGNPPYSGHSANDSFRVVAKPVTIKTPKGPRNQPSLFVKMHG